MSASSLRSGAQTDGAQRYPRGECSAEGCYVDTHDHGALKRVLLDPLGPGGDRRFQPAVYDHTADTALSPPVTTARADAVLLFDGVFLLRPELIGRWDLRVYVSTAFEATVDRAPAAALRRDGPPDGSRRHHRAQRRPSAAGLGDRSGPVT